MMKNYSFYRDECLELSPEPGQTRSIFKPKRFCSILILGSFEIIGSCFITSTSQTHQQSWNILHFSSLSIVISPSDRGYTYSNNNKRFSFKFFLYGQSLGHYSHYTTYFFGHYSLSKRIQFSLCKIIFSTASVEIVFLFYDCLVRVDEDFIFIYDFLLQPSLPGKKSVIKSQWII